MVERDFTDRNRRFRRKTPDSTPLAYFGASALGTLCYGRGVGWIVDRTYAWRRLYEDALLETDPSRLPVLIREAHAAIDARMVEIGDDREGTGDEQQAIADALAGLRVLKTEIETN